MPFDPQHHHRRSIRLKPHDYSLSATYFVTLCVWNRECLFGEIADGNMQESDAGNTVTQFWSALPERFPHVVLREFVVMPNHFHGILVVRKTEADTHTPNLGQVMRAYKSLTGIVVNRLLGRAEYPLWQRNYYERNIRDAADYENIRRYIALNPTRWHSDIENPDNASPNNAPVTENPLTL